MLEWCDKYWSCDESNCVLDLQALRNQIFRKNNFVRSKKKKVFSFHTETNEKKKTDDNYAIVSLSCEIIYTYSDGPWDCK